MGQMHTLHLSHCSKTKQILSQTFSMFARTVLSDEPEHMPGDISNLNLIAAFRDSVAAMMTIDVLELFVARIAPTAMHLHRPVGGVANKVVALVIAHRDLVGEIE